MNDNKDKLKNTFAGTINQEVDYNILYNSILEAVLIEQIKGKKQTNKDFVTPEQFIVRYKAPYKQVVSVLYKLTKDGYLRDPFKKMITNTRQQIYFYYNLNTQQAKEKAKKLVE